MDISEIRKEKEMRDEAIISEYGYIKDFTNDVLYFVSSDRNAISMAKDRKFDSVFEIVIPNEIGESYSCDFEQSANLIFHLTLLFGTIKLSKYGLIVNIWWPSKLESQWEEKWLEIKCSDNNFLTKIKSSIQLIRVLNNKFS